MRPEVELLVRAGAEALEADPFLLRSNIKCEMLLWVANRRDKAGPTTVAGPSTTDPARTGRKQSRGKLG